MTPFTPHAIAVARQALSNAEWSVCIGLDMGGFEDIVSTAISYSTAGYRKVPSMFFLEF
ncbi:hypothetical protein BDA99DRAFT_554464 [Phascolomyces articulosus]|uniref:Uncharacterized protein n=1 Tax=Phascolomyces articulosus TaxID=60185 RepID=A0AAD5PMV5_9FUNG|nr:hypothetical protein BDA99DRAFT_554464 [Phascolomyces articulosus]